MKLIAPLLVLLTLGAPLSAETRFWLRNTDASQILIWWAVPYSATPGTALGALALPSVTKHSIAPTERVEVILPDGAAFLGVFVPWRQPVALTTALTAGWILASETPTSGTLQADSRSFAASNKTRAFTATLQEWGLEAFPVVLDGDGADWAGVPAVLEWGSRFQPPQGPWPLGLPRLQTLSVLKGDRALWLKLGLDSAALPPGTSASLLMESGSLRLEWPLVAGTGSVWRWEGDRATAAGQTVVRASVLESWVDLNRLPHQVLGRASAPSLRLLWAVSTPQGTASFDVGALELDDGL